VLDGERGESTLRLFVQEDSAQEQGSMAGKVRNFQSIDIISGTWGLDQAALGNSSTTVREGTELVLTEPVVLGPNGRIGGTGDIYGDLYNDSGTVGAGESIGMLTINGNHGYGPDA